MGKTLHMKKLSLLFAFTAAFGIQAVSAQYTDVINSNRPGGSASAYAVGKNVLQLETGLLLERQEHDLLRTESNIFGGDFALRYGFLFEELEIIWEGTFVRQKITDNSTSPSVTGTQSNFTEHAIGARYLIYDPYKKERKPNLYSWKANNSFKWSDLIPAISIYAGANLNLDQEKSFFPNDPIISPRVMLATQSHLGPRWVFVSNIIYEKVTSDDPVFNYILTLTHSLPNPKYSVFVEHQGFKSDAYGDGFFRGGAARLINKNFQVDASLGINIKNTPSRIFGQAGFSYRLDNHKDEFKAIDNVPDQDKDALKDAKKTKKRKKKNKNPFEDNGNTL